MAMSPAEKQRKYRERKRKAEAAASVSVEDVFKTPFCEYYEPDRMGTDFDVSLILAGIETPVFNDDEGVLAHTVYPDPDTLDDSEVVQEATNSLGRAEFIVESLICAAISLADSINHYKRLEIGKRLKELEDRDLSTSEAKKIAMREASRLNKMLDQIDKSIRVTFPEWKATD